MRKILREAAAAAVCFGLGACVLIAVLEAGLSAASVLMSRPGRISGDGTYTVLCLGDSFTYGMGGESYPDQLSRRMAAEGLRVRVVNRGVAGMNSAQLAESVGAELGRHRPNAVIVVVGADNFWNSLPIDGGGPRRRLDGRLLGLRSYRLIKLLWVGAREGSLRARYRRSVTPASREEALSVLGASLETEFPLDWFRLQLGDRPEGPRVEAAAVAVAALLAADPGDAQARLQLARQHLKFGDAAKAERLFREGLDAGSCEPSFFSGLAAARQRLGDSVGARRALDGDGRPQRCVLQRRLARAEWHLWRGEPRAAAAAYRRVLPDLTGSSMRSAAMLGLAQAIYRLEDYDGAITLLNALARSSPAGNGEVGGLLSQAWALKWERARRYGSVVPPPAEMGEELSYSHYHLGEYDRCSQRALEGLKKDPLSASLFNMYTMCLRRRGRMWDALAAPDAVPAVRDNLFYRYLAGVKKQVDSRGRTLEALQEERFEADMRAIVLAARSHGAQVLLSSYPQEDYLPVRRAALVTGAAYLDLTALFRARFRSREEYMSSDGCHPNTPAYAVMAEAMEKELSSLPGFPAGGSR